MVEVYQTVETSIVPALNGLNADEGNPAVALLDQLLCMKPNIKQEVSVKDLQFRLVIDPSFQADHEMLDRGAFLSNNLGIFIDPYLPHLNHRLHDQSRYFKVLVVLNSPNKLINNLHIK